MGCPSRLSRWLVASRGGFLLVANEVRVTGNYQVLRVRGSVHGPGDPSARRPVTVLDDVFTFMLMLIIILVGSCESWVQT